MQAEYIQILKKNTPEYIQILIKLVYPDTLEYIQILKKLAKTATALCVLHRLVYSDTLRVYTDTQS